jgi:hypothetical protein
VKERWQRRSFRRKSGQFLKPVFTDALASVTPLSPH